MKIPVIIYGLVISAMLYFAVRTSNKNLILGAVLFVISDSILSINLFVKETIILSLLVMVTYVAAQWFLVKGMLSNPKKSELSRKKVEIWWNISQKKSSNNYKSVINV